MAQGPSTERAPTPTAAGGSPLRTVALVVILSVFWLLLSGRIGVQYFIFMACAVGIVVLMNPERPSVGRQAHAAEGGAGLGARATGLVRFVTWTLRAILVANVDVARRILSPSLPIRPQLMVFRTDHESALAQVTVANTITLTPGTCTMDLQDGTFLVHALHPDTAGAVVSGELQNVVGPMFGERKSPPPEVLWAFAPIELRQVIEVVPAETIEAALLADEVEGMEGAASDTHAGAGQDEPVNPWSRELGSGGRT